MINFKKYINSIVISLENWCNSGFQHFYFLLAVAILTQTIIFLGTTIMVFSDSGTYVVAAVRIKDFFDFSSLSINRTPGYPLLLVGLLKIFPENFTFALRFTQHLMAVIIILMVYFISFLLFKDRLKSLLCGLLSCFSLQIWSYANYVMTELFYSFILAFIIYFYMQYAETKKYKFLLFSFVFTGFATNIRPIAQLLVVFLCVLFTIFLLNKKNANKLKSTFLFLIGAVFYLSSILPWMIYNSKHNGFFAMTKCVGLNLYSRVVEYEKIVDYDSVYIKDIKESFERNIAFRKEKEGLEQRKSWKYYDYYFGPDAWKRHIPAFCSYFQDKKIKLAADVDDVLLRASLDCIKKYPFEYFKNTFRYVVLMQLVVEPTVLYIPGLRSYNTGKYPYKGLLDAEKAHRDVLDVWVHDPTKRYVKFNAKPNIFTKIYAYIASTYYYFIMSDNKKILFFLFLIIGFCVSIINIFKSPNKLVWFIFSGIIIYNLIIPMLFVPGTYRMRIPIDPFMVIFYFLGFLTLIRLINFSIDKFITFYYCNKIKIKT
ncbi:MAG: glycosyltransferase family 39 protein [Candidatus Omnitrophota bacterium]